MRKKLPRDRRIDRIAHKRARLAEKKAEWKGATRKPLKRKETQSRSKPLIAYDLETTRIAKGTPRPLYFTAFGEFVSISTAVRDVMHLAEILRERVLIEEFRNARFVAWNGNGYDVFFIGAALLHCTEFELRPYLTRSKALRGLRVQHRTTKHVWEFLDGIAMTGIIGKTLEQFLDVFTPDYRKLKAPNWDKEEFDADNAEHRRYAERDSEGLYHAMVRANRIVHDTFGVPLQPTIGNTGIRIFCRNIPPEVQVWAPSLKVVELIRNYVMRGGFCFCVRRYEGPVWKYDLNQAYAAAMRDTPLPTGRCMHVRRFHRYQCGIYRCAAENPSNRIPFYYKTLKGDAVVAMRRIEQTWLTSVEIEQLMRERWNFNIAEGYIWDGQFQMRAYVDKLEQLRMSSPGGPNGAQGLMVKAIGNNSYGKTVETLDGIELILSHECPEGFMSYQAEDDLLQHVWCRFTNPHPREYHQPQIGSFITAHVRMEVRRAALQNPDAWLYADTDCVIFSEPAELNLDPKRYGFWKQEEAGAKFRIIAKKVYASEDASVKHAKGLNVKRLSAADFDAWLRGVPPTQTQIQRNNFLKVMVGMDMFVERVKTGERMKNA